MSGIDIYTNAKTLLFKVYNTFYLETSQKKRTRIYMEFIEILNALAIGGVLFKMDRTRFSQNLMRAAEAGRGYLLELIKSHQQIPSSYNRPLISALCIQHYELANDIVGLSATEQITPEYEDEYLLNQIIVLLLSAVVHKTKIDKFKLAELCNQLEIYLEESSWACNFYRVLADSEIDCDKLVDSFIAWHDFVLEEYNRKEFMQRGTYWDTLNRHLWLEGLAVLNLCNALGLNINERFALIPDIVKAIKFSEPQMDAILGETISTSKDKL